MLALILSLRVGILLEYDGAIKLRLRVLCFTFPFPKKRVKTEKEQEKAKAKKIKKAQKKKEKKENTPTGGEKTSVLDVVSAVYEARATVASIVSKFFGYLHVRVFSVLMIVASDDAATTAQRYGLVTAGISGIVAILDEGTKFDFARRATVHVEPNFRSNEGYAWIKVTMTVRVAAVLYVLIKAALAALGTFFSFKRIKEERIRKKKAKETLHEQQ